MSRLKIYGVSGAGCPYKVAQIKIFLHMRLHFWSKDFRRVKRTFDGMDWAAVAEKAVEVQKLPVL